MSTTTCAVDLMDFIYEKIDQGKIVTGVFLDLTKAFDMVVHEVLLNQLEKCGVRGVPLNLFKDYLTNREQYVSLSSVNSEPRSITRGIPQGSCLGPLLFLVSINDLPSSDLIGTLCMFADDAALFYNCDDINVNVQEASVDLETVQSQLNGIGLFINVAKSACISTIHVDD